MSAVLQLLLGTSVYEMLPSLFESDTALNRNNNFIKRNLHTVSSVPYSLSQCNRKCSNPKVPVMGQIPSEVLNKDYIRKEMLESEEFLNRLIENNAQHVTFFLLSGFSFTNIHESQDYRGRKRALF